MGVQCGGARSTVCQLGMANRRTRRSHRQGAEGLHVENGAGSIVMQVYKQELVNVRVRHGTF